MDDGATRCGLCEAHLPWDRREQNTMLGCEPSDPLRSIQKRPEPKYVPAIVFQGSNQGDWNLSKFCQNLKTTFWTNAWQIFDKFQSSSVFLTGTLKNNRRDKFWTNLRFGALLNAVRGQRVHNARVCLSPFFREPVVYTPDSRGFRDFPGSRPGHLRPTDLVSRIFEIRFSNPTRGECRKCGMPRSTQKNKVWGDSTGQSCSENGLFTPSTFLQNWGGSWVSYFYYLECCSAVDSPQ